jgi:ribonuclease III
VEPLFYGDQVSKPIDGAADWAASMLHHRFNNEALLSAALTHSSAVGATYERLEFLGDRVLGLVIASWLFDGFPDEPEGKLNRRMSDLVRRDACAAVARTIGVVPFIQMERAARMSGVQHSDNVLGDVCEALIAALYIDGGMNVATQFIRAQWRLMLQDNDSASQDPKSALQEWAQGRGLPLPSYALVGQSGPDHAPSFEIEVRVPGYEPAVAAAASKQEAQKRAAAELLAKLEKNI